MLAKRFGVAPNVWRRACSRILVLILVTMVTAIVGCAEEDIVGSSDDELNSGAASPSCKGGSALAAAARRREGKRSQRLCYRHVKAHLRRAGFSTGAVQATHGRSAYMFATWAKSNPKALAKMGLKPIKSALDSLPQGAILVWARGQCGYSSKHGHIEIVADKKSTRACSDFCHSIRKNCGAPSIFVSKSCSTVAVEDDDPPIDLSKEDDDLTSGDAETDSGESEGEVELEPGERAPGEDAD